MFWSLMRWQRRLPSDHPKLVASQAPMWLDLQGKIVDLQQYLVR